MNLWEKATMFKSRTEKLLDRMKLSKRPTPSLPQKLTKTQARILEVASERGEVIGGSFAQKTLYPQSRKFNDIDIISRNPQRTAEHIQSKLKFQTISERGRHGKYVIKNKSGKILADVVPSLYYKKYVKQYGEIPAYNVSGVKVLREDILYREKVSAIKYGNPRLKQKNINDLKFLSER